MASVAKPSRASVLAVWNDDVEAVLIGEPALVEGMFHRKRGAE
jgi:hypothetical protein